MKKVEVKIIIKEVEDWVVNWDDEKETKGELKNLEHQIEEAISRNLGINFSNVVVYGAELSD